MARRVNGYTILCLAIIWLACLFQTPLRAQPIRRPLRVITTRDGLPQSFVSGIIQDSTGLIWVGTRSGLARFDGRQFKEFHHNRYDSTTLSSDVIISMTRDARNRIWIEHESGQIDQLSPTTQQIGRLSQQALLRQHPVQFARRGWVVDRQGRLWGTQLKEGIWCYDWGRQTIHQYTHQRDGLPSDTIRGLLASRNGSIWLLSRNHLSRLNPATGNLLRVSLPVPIAENHLPLIAGGTVRLHECQNGKILWSDNGQLFSFAPATGRFRRMQLPPQSADGLSWFYTGPDGQDYFTAVNHVYRYNPAGGLVLVGTLEQPWQRTESMLIDRAGLIWLGTNATGIQQLDLLGPAFESHPNQLGFHPDLFQQAFGLSIAHTFDWPVSDDGFRRLSYYLRSTYDNHGRLWVGLRYWAGYYDSTQRRLVLLPPIPSRKPTVYRRLGISGMRFDSKENLWTVDSEGNVAFFDPLHGQWTPWLTADALHRVDATELMPIDLIVDQQAIWMTIQQKGLVRVDRITKQIRLITQATPSLRFPTNQLLGMQPDPTRANLMWIGSYNGLICFNKATAQSQLFTIANGLPDNTIYSLLVDQAGYLWLSTNKGLCRFHPRTHQVRTLTNTEGLLGDEFNRFHHLRLPDGRLAFGGPDGWMLLDPKSIHEDRFQPPVALTELKINNQLVESISGQQILSLPVNALKNLVVPYSQNTLSFAFAGLEYNQPSKLQYRYQLEGYDTDWVIAGLSPQAAYTQLPPGRYTLRVNATNTTGQWSRYIHALSITINPPWWRTSLAYLLYLLSGIGLIHYYIRYRTQREREHHQLLAKQREAEQLRMVDEMKTRFFTNITHEFRTPITLILTPTEQLKQSIHQPEHQYRLATIDRNAHQLLTLVNQLLDLSKLEAGALSVAEAQGDLVGFVRKIVESFDSQAKAQSVQLFFHSASTPLYYWFDADKLERILLNLISNALKFTPAGGQIALQLETANQMVQITVSDTGIGIAADQLVHIFERFYQVNDSTTGDHEGTGIGLALVKELVDLQGGQIMVTSQPGEGTTFTLQLPYRVAMASSQPVVIDALAVPLESDNTPESPIVLLVEDNSELAHFIATSLPAHYTIHQAANGEEGLQQALKTMPDLIISDVLMPVMDGYTLVSKLKADWRTSHIPVILLTAKSALDSRLKGLSLGADDYITKPFHIQELQLRVRNKLEQSQQLRSWLQARLLQPNTDESEKQASLTDSFLDLVYQTLDQHLDDASFGPDELVMQLKVSRMSLYRKLKALTDLSTGEFIRSYRLKRATEFLRKGMPSGETAYRVGFESPAYFTRCFREAYQMTPSEFAAQTKPSA